MNVKYDPTVDAAYIRLTDSDVSEVDYTYACDPKEVGGQVHLDFDASGRLIGIEVLQASKKLPKSLLGQ
jgi:uncharacterized protein YuzE